MAFSCGLDNDFLLTCSVDTVECINDSILGGVDSVSALARDILGRLHCRSIYLNPEQGSIEHDLIELSRIGLAAVQEGLAARRLEILSRFGYGDTPQAADKPFAFAAGTAFIPVHGALLNRHVWSSPYATGYSFIRSQMQAALADPDVERMVFDINSYGGMAAGCDELSADIYASRQQKPSLAVVDGSCYSAAYFTGSACTEMRASPSAGVGSIGVVAMHVDFSGMLEQDGIKVTFIHAGENKVDGNPYEKLSERARAGIQSDVDYHMDLFVAAVHRNRGISEADIRATEADCFMPPDALRLGLIDGIASPSEAIASFISSSNTPRNPVMSTEAGMTPEQIQAAIAQGVATGVKTALAAEKARRTAIVGSEAGKQRPTLAAHLADNTEMSEAEAIKLLETAAVEPKPVGSQGNGNPAFTAAMNGGQHPNVGADFGAAGGPGGEETSEQRVSGILGAYTALTGRKVIPLGGNA